MDDWYYGEGNETRGPLNFESLVAILSNVSRWSEVFVWKQGFKNWIKAGEVSELVRAIEPAPPPLPVRQVQPVSIYDKPAVEILQPMAPAAPTPRKSTTMATAGSFLAGSAGVGMYIAYLAVGIFQISAFAEGMQLYFKLGGFISFIIFLIVYNVPFGVFGLAYFTYYGARYGWRWEWWQAFAMAVPGVCLWIVIAIFGGATSLFQKRGR